MSGLKIFHFKAACILIATLQITACRDAKIVSGNYGYSNTELAITLEISGDGSFRQIITRKDLSEQKTLTGTWRQKNSEVSFRPFLMPLDFKTGKPLAIPFEYAIAYGAVEGDYIAFNPDYGYVYRLEFRAPVKGE